MAPLTRPCVVTLRYLLGAAWPRDERRRPDSCLVEQLVLVFVVLFATILAQPLSRTLHLSSAVLMTVFGGVLAAIPAVPTVGIDPELILPVVLPPLLYASARRTSWRQFAENWLPITTRAVGLVLATTATVAVVFHRLMPGLPIATAVALGALVAPPDPVAATAVAGSLGLPRRLVSVLEGEGLFNDVTAIVVYSVAIQAVVTGHFSEIDAVLNFLESAGVAMGVGLVLGWVGVRLMRYLNEAVWQVAMSLLLPFAAYAMAQAWHGSAVLAVLVCALYLTEAVGDFGDSAYRLIGDSFWDIIEMLVSGFAFGLIGLELRTVLRSVGHHWGPLWRDTAAVLAVVVGLRLVWLMAMWWGFHKWRRWRDADEAYTWQETLVTWWSGMRGMVTVALALAVPLTTTAGEAFPGRSSLLFVAFAVVLFTLLVQGPTLPAFVRLTGVHADTEAERELERRLWKRVLHAELTRLKELAATRDLPDEVYEGLRSRLRSRLARADPEAADDDAKAAADRDRAMLNTMREITAEVLDAGRTEAMTARREPGVPPDVIDRLLRRLDMRSAPR
jgi:CPA1 family monovalent cation:H+ antiporter